MSALAWTAVLEAVAIIGLVLAWHRGDHARRRAEADATALKGVLDVIFANRGKLPGSGDHEASSQRTQRGGKGGAT